MSDPIERQDVIDEAEKWIEAYNSGRGGQRERDAIKHVISGIKKLPSAEPEKRTEKHTETHGVCLDAIDRQAAIDAFKPYADYESNRTNADWVRRIELVLHDLPSAITTGLDKEEISELLNRIYQIQSPHLSAEGVIAKQYYCEELWKKLFPDKEFPVWMCWTWHRKDGKADEGD